MKNWTDLFAPLILQRGKNYHSEGRVSHLKYEYGSYSAVVSGTENYWVSILISYDVIEEMTCSCPYAESGNYCKHMAAVLYAMEQKGLLSTQKQKQKQERLSASELVCSMTEAQVREFLTELAQDDAEIFHKLSLRYEKFPETERRELLLSELDSITEKYTVYGEIPYKNAYDYAYDLSEFIEELPMTQFRCGKPHSILEIAIRALEKYCAQEVDDSDGGTSLIGDSFLSCVEDLLARCTPAQTQEIFFLLSEYRSRKEIHWIIADMLDNVIDSFFEGSAFAESKLNLIQTRLEHEDFTDSDWERDALLTKKYFLLRSLPGKAQEYEEFCKQYKNSFFFRQASIKALVEEGDYERAIPLLLESRKLDADHPTTVRWNTETLIHIYQKTGDTEKLRGALLYHIRNFNQKDLNYLLELKNLVSAEDWAGYRAEYLAREYEYIRLPLLEHEELWEELMSAAAQDHSMQTLLAYEKSLYAKFPNRFCEVLAQKLQDMANVSSNRKDYRHLMEDLVHLVRYPEGRPIALKLAAEWRTRYSRRSAMMDELAQRGF